MTQVKKPTKALQDLLGNRTLPEGTLDFLTNTLQLDPKNRLSAATCLTHPFLRPLRDADLKERKNRQLEEKRKQTRSSSAAGDGDEGIEEEIPGEKQRSRPPSSPDAKADAKSPSSTPLYKAGPRPFDFKSLEDSVASTLRSRDRRGVMGGECVRASSKSADNNTGDGDSDDIQEIIEMDENAPGTPHRDPPGSKQNGLSNNGIGARLKNLCRRNSTEGKCVDDPLEHECYEDDFEDYHS